MQTLSIAMAVVILIYQLLEKIFQKKIPFVSLAW
jgi:hypothetical protein